MMASLDEKKQRQVQHSQVVNRIRRVQEDEMDKALDRIQDINVDTSKIYPDVVP